MEERLRKFAQLVDAGSFTAASQTLHISQPALSTAISKLERELGTALLVRGGHALRLTESGALAYEAAKEVGVVKNNLIAEVSQITKQRPAIAIGMIDSVASALFADAVNLEELEHQAKLSIVVNNSRYLTNAIAHDELDIAIVTGQSGQNMPAIAETPITTEPLVIVCHPSEAKAVYDATKQGRLTRFISYDRPSTTSRMIADWLDAHHISVEPSLFSTSPEVMLRLVLLGKGIAVLPYLVVKNHLEQGILSIVGSPRPIVIERPISLITRRNKLLTTPLETTVAQVDKLFTSYRAEVETR